MNNPQMDDLQRSVGRVEGALTQVLAKLDVLGLDLGDHKNEDQKNFSSIRKLVYEQRDAFLTTINDANISVARKLEETNKIVADKLSSSNIEREQHLSSQDDKLDALKQDSDRAKGAGWVILGLLGAVAAFLGSAVIAALNGHFIWK